MQLLSFPREEYERNRHLDCQQPGVQFPASARFTFPGAVFALARYWRMTMARDLRERRSRQANTVAERTLVVDEVIPHEQAEQDVPYPVVDCLVGGNDPTGPMNRAHAEIAHQIRRLGQVLGDIGPGGPDSDDVTELRGLLYGLYAVLRLHTTQEEESCLSLADETDLVPS